ncbi:MAG TPA: hypothetical protein VFF72_05860 [Caldimonas sp.]|nr:hypothetical protein [Caldimonas sp.]
MNDESVTRIESRNEFRAAVGTALAKAAQDGASEICMIDPRFVDWPLNDPAIVELLSRWVSSRRRCLVMAHGFDDLVRAAPRFVEWRRQWSHVVQCRTTEEIEADQVPTLLWVREMACLKLLDRVRYGGTFSGREIDLVETRETIDALLQRSVEAFPATTLGL